MKLSIVTTLYYSAPYINEFYNRICNVADATQRIMIIFVNDGSPDNAVGGDRPLPKKTTECA